MTSDKLSRVQDFMEWLEEEHEGWFSISILIGVLIGAIIFVAIGGIIALAIRIHFLWYVYALIALWYGTKKCTALLDEYHHSRRDE